MEHLTDCGVFSLFFGAVVGSIIGMFFSGRILYRVFQDEVRKANKVDKTKEKK